MDWLKGYLIAVVCAGMICAITSRLMSKGGISSALIKLLSGVIMTITIISPVLKLDFKDINTLWDAYSFDASAAVALGQANSKDSLRQRIIELCEEYVLTEAGKLDLKITAEIELNDEDIPLPVCVRISGQASPYSKNALTETICTAFNLKKENIQWI